MKISLASATLLGKGNERLCYIHPHDETKCIKIDIKKDDRKHLPEQSLVEADYYEYLKKKDVALDHLPDCYGWVETDLGVGLVFDRIMSTTDGKSITLHEAISQLLLTKQEVQRLLDELYLYLIRNSILLSDINSGNLCVSFIGNEKLFLVDGLGARNYDKKYFLKKKIPLLARYKTIRQWRRYHHKCLP
ncbi:YrbL family protein [Billgrantia sp. LNSP4103-1]|uniref:YrbL family protein n=1 Tax=Billgrantia sp. LNSP4103-1 TaxID=3410266 RepID=UPI00403F977B